MTNKILLIGSSGMLGRAWKQLLEQNKIKYDCPDSKTINLTDRSSINFAISPQYSWVINCSAWTNVDGAEQNKSKAFAINATGVGWLAERCRDVGNILIHYSTDYIFDGKSSTPYSTDDPYSPCNTYGLSKAEGEKLIITSGVKYLIIRTSWLYAPWSNNFVRKIIQLSRNNSEIKVVNDQRGCPTSSQHLAKMSLKLMEHNVHMLCSKSIFHITDGGDCSWFEFATTILNKINPSCIIKPCTSSEFPQFVYRPNYSVLDIKKTESYLGPMPSWRNNLEIVLQSLE